MATNTNYNLNEESMASTQETILSTTTQSLRQGTDTTLITEAATVSDGRDTTTVTTTQDAVTPTRRTTVENDDSNVQEISKSTVIESTTDGHRVGKLTHETSTKRSSLDMVTEMAPMRLTTRRIVTPEGMQSNSAMHESANQMGVNGQGFINREAMPPGKHRGGNAAASVVPWRFGVFSVASAMVIVMILH